MSADVFVKRGADHGPDFFRHEAAGLAWLAAAPGGRAAMGLSHAVAMRAGRRALRASALPSR